MSGRSIRYILIFMMVYGCTGMKKELKQLNERIEKIEFKTGELSERVVMIEKEIEDIADTSAIRAKAQKDILKEIYEVKKALNELREYVYSFQKYTQLRRKKESAESLYRKAYDLFSSTRYNQAILLFARILREFPRHPLADNALYWTGECYYKMGEVERALSAFKEVLTRYPTGNKVADAKIKIALIYHQRGNSNDALKILDDVIKTTRDQDAVNRAINLRNEITKFQGGEE